MDTFKVYLREKVLMEKISQSEFIDIQILDKYKRSKSKSIT